MPSVHLGHMQTVTPIDYKSISDSFNKGVNTGMVLGKLAVNAKHASEVEDATKKYNDEIAAIKADEDYGKGIAPEGSAKFEGQDVPLPGSEALPVTDPDIKTRLNSAPKGMPAKGAKQAIPVDNAAVNPGGENVALPGSEAIPNMDTRQGASARLSDQPTAPIDGRDYSPEAFARRRRDALFARDSAIRAAGMRRASALGDVETVDRLRAEQDEADFTNSFANLWDDKDKRRSIMAEYMSRTLPDGQHYQMGADGTYSIIDANGNAVRTGIQVSPQMEAEIFQDLYVTQKMMALGKNKEFMDWFKEQRNYHLNLDKFNFSKQEHADKMAVEADKIASAEKRAAMSAAASVRAAELGLYGTMYRADQQLAGVNRAADSRETVAGMNIESKEGIEAMKDATRRHRISENTYTKLVGYEYQRLLAESKNDAAAARLAEKNYNDLVKQQMKIDGSLDVEALRGDIRKGVQQLINSGKLDVAKENNAGKRERQINAAALKKDLQRAKLEHDTFHKNADRELRKAISEDTIAAGLTKSRDTADARERVAETKAAADRYAAELRQQGVVLSNRTRSEIEAAAREVKLYGIDALTAARNRNVDVKYVLGVLNNDTKLSGYAMRLLGVLDKNAASRSIADAQNIQRTFETYMKHGDENGAFALAKEHGVVVHQVDDGPYKGQIVYVGANGKPYRSVAAAIRNGSKGAEATKTKNRSELLSKAIK